MSSALLVLSTASSLREARRLSRLLLQKKLAACINISGRVESHYRWKGKLEKAGEVMLLIKTKIAAFKRLEKVLQKSHSYSVPEIIALPIQKGNRQYLRWLNQETQI